MLKNTLVNKGVIKRVAEALGELNEEVIYVGGATVSLYINDPAAEDVRPTKDLDISLSLVSVGEFECRGGNDPRTSHDLEDIIYILDYRTDILGQLTSAPEDVIAFLRDKLSLFLNNPLMKEALESNLEYESRDVRSERIRNIISSFVN